MYRITLRSIPAIICSVRFADESTKMSNFKIIFLLKKPVKYFYKLRNFLRFSAYELIEWCKLIEWVFFPIAAAICCLGRRRVQASFQTAFQAAVTSESDRTLRLLFTKTLYTARVKITPYCSGLLSTNKLAVYTAAKVNSTVKLSHSTYSRVAFIACF